MLRGSDEIVSACQKISGITNFGESSPDGLFTLSEVECMGACVNAPMIQINDDYFEDLDAERMEKLLLDLKSGKPLPPAGSTKGRHNSEPEPGRTTLLEHARAPDNA
jgi:NADH-quinone oxidoreductase subunit E